MPQVPITLKAGQPTRQGFGDARYLTLVSLGVASTVNLQIEAAGGLLREEVRGLKMRDRIAVETGFDAATFTAPVDCTIEVFASLMDLRLNNGDGSEVNANILGTVPVSIASPLPVPVQNDRGGSLAAPVFVSGLTYTDTPAGSLLNAAAVAMGAAAAQIIAANANRLELRITNLGTVPVAVGAAGITWASRCIVLQPGDTWVEAKGAALAWHGITETAASSVTVQELRA